MSSKRFALAGCAVNESAVADTRTSSGLIHVQKNEPERLNEAARSPTCQHSPVSGRLSV